MVRKVESAIFPRLRQIGNSLSNSGLSRVRQVFLSFLEDIFESTLILDAGLGKKLDEESDFYVLVKNKKLETLIDDHATTAIITHQHNDHFNYLQTLLEETSPKEIKDIIIGGKAKKTFPSKIKNTDIRFVNNPATFNWKDVYSCLGKDISVIPILPAKWEGDREHDQNLVIKVTYKGRSILFTGNANGELLNNIL